MPHIESNITIAAPLELVWKLAQDVEKLPDIMPDLDAVKIIEREQRSADTIRIISEWHGRITKFNRKVDWVEEDIWNTETHTCHFWQLRGDFSEYSGAWGFVSEGAGTRAELIVDYRFEVPLIGPIIQKVVLKIMQDNSDGMLKALKDEAERLAKYEIRDARRRGHGLSCPIPMPSDVRTIDIAHTMSTKQVIIAILCGVFLWIGTAGADSSSKASATLTPEQILWWMPEDTETFFVSHGARTLDLLQRSNASNKPSMPSVNATLQSLSILPVALIGQDNGITLFMGRKLILSAEGSRKFRRPAGLGLMPYEGCSVLVFMPSPAPSGGISSPIIGNDPLPKWLNKHASKKEVIDGQVVWDFTKKEEQDQWLLYVAQPKPDILLCATNRDFLRSVLIRMHRPGQKRALDASLPEWKELDQSSKFWAIRHYDPSQARLDPSSPGNGDAPDKLATGFVFAFEPNLSNRATIKFITTNQNAIHDIERYWRSAYTGTRFYDWAPQSTRTSADVVEFSLPLDGDSIPMYSFVLMLMLGHGVLV